MRLVLHHCYQSRSVRTLNLLHELDVDFEMVVHRFGPDLYTPEYRAIHPGSRVPALEIDDKIMFETGAIAEYLTELFPESGLGRPPGHPERAEFLQWLHYAETIAQHLAALTQQHVVIQPFEAKSPVITKLEKLRLGRTLAVLNHQLQDQEYLLKSGFSVVDINHGYGIHLAQRFISFEGMDNVRAYYERIKARPAFAKSRTPDGETGLYSQDFYEVING